MRSLLRRFQDSGWGTYIGRLTSAVLSTPCILHIPAYLKRVSQNRMFWLTLFVFRHSDATLPNNRRGGARSAVELQQPFGQGETYFAALGVEHVHEFVGCRDKYLPPLGLYHEEGIASCLGERYYLAPQVAPLE